MFVLALIGFLAFVGCIVLLIWSAIKKKTKRYWAIGIGVSFILFMVGAVNSSNTPPAIRTKNNTLMPTSTPTPVQKLTSTPVSVSTPNQPQANVQFQAGALVEDATLVVTNTGTSTWYGFKITLQFVDTDPSYNDNYTETGLDQNTAFYPNRQIVTYDSYYVDNKGNNLTAWTTGAWPFGTYTITSMTARLTPNGKYQTIALAPGASNVFTVDESDTNPVTPSPTLTPAPAVTTQSTTYHDSAFESLGNQ